MRAVIQTSARSTRAADLLVERDQLEVQRLQLGGPVDEEAR